MFFLRHCSFNTQNRFSLLNLTAFIFFIQFFFLAHAYAQKDSLAFGTREWISNGLKGKVYYLPPNTSRLPDFDTMKSVGTLYAQKIDIPVRDWETGFPGIPGRFEWFGIEYKSYFKVERTGHYVFTLNSDDGSRLYIDDSLIVNNDGLHPPSGISGEIDLDGSRHFMKLQYFQGPRNQIALQLFAGLKNEKLQVFPGNNFSLYTPGLNHKWLLESIILLILVILLILLLFKKRKSGVNQLKMKNHNV